MDLHQFLPAMLNVLPGKKIHGKKKLQKIVHLMKEAGGDIGVDDYEIHLYGPFSYQVANAAEELSIFGNLTENMEQVGPYGTYQYVYGLEENTGDISELESGQADLLKELNDKSTTILEVASTVAFFLRDSTHEDAIEKTKYLKPTKTTGYVLGQAEEVLSLVKKAKK